MDDLVITTIGVETYYTLGNGDDYIGKCIVKIRKHIQSAHIVYLYVKEEYRKQGYGNHIITFVENSLRENGINTVTLDAKEDSSKYGKLFNWYKAHGYIISGNERYINENDILYRVALFKKLIN